MNINVGHHYKDLMDSTRTLIPVDAAGNCKVYFEGKGGRKDYVGMTKMPPSLFRTPVFKDGKMIRMSDIFLMEDVEVRRHG